MKTFQLLNNVPLIVQNHIHTINMYDSDYIMICNKPMTSVENTLNKIYFGGILWGEFTSEYYNDKNYTFGLLFQQYTARNDDNIYHLSIANEWKANMEKSSYEDKHDLGVYRPSGKSELY